MAKNEKDSTDWGRVFFGDGFDDEKAKRKAKNSVKKTVSEGMAKNKKDSTDWGRVFFGDGFDDDKPKEEKIKKDSIKDGTKYDLSLPSKKLKKPVRKLDEKYYKK